MMLATALLASLVSLTPFERGQTFRCLTPHLLPMPPVDRARVWPQPSSGDKTERDAWGSYPNMLTTGNFALKWGTSGGVSQATAQHLIDTFEHAWDVEINHMGMPPPYGSTAYLFNVYIGDTGSGTPSTYDAGGYFYFDDAGQPMIVINPDSLFDTEGAESVAPHEFFHAVEDATGSYPGYEGAGAWYWEASAEWAVAEVYPNLAYQGSFLGGYILVPHYPVNLFDYADTGAFTEMHQYGAFIFPRHLSENEVDRNLVVDSWTRAGWEDDDPLVVIDGLLADEGIELEEAFVRFAAHNATLDYAAHDLYEWTVDSFADYYPEWDYQIADQVPSAGTDDWRDAPTDTLPERFGYNLIEMKNPNEGALTVDFEGEATGSRGSAARFGAAVVREYASGREYVELDLNENAGTLDIPDVGNERSIWLAVAAFSDRIAEGETFAYRYRFAVHAGTHPNPNPATPPVRRSDRYHKDGSCSQVPGSLWLAPALALLWVRRRTSER